MLCVENLFKIYLFCKCDPRLRITYCWTHLYTRWSDENQHLRKIVCIQFESKSEYRSYEYFISLFWFYLHMCALYRYRLHFGEKTLLVQTNLCVFTLIVIRIPRTFTFVVVDVALFTFEFNIKWASLMSIMNTHNRYKSRFCHMKLICACKLRAYTFVSESWSFAIVEINANWL